MNRKILTLLFISFISVCLVVGFLGRNAIAAEDDEKREGQAFERETVCYGGICFETGRQWTSPEDIMRGEYYTPFSYQTMTPNYMAASPYSQSYEYQGSDIGGLGGMQPAMRWQVSPMSYAIGTIGASQTQMQQFSDPFIGSFSSSSMYPGLGIPSGAMLGPYRQNIWSGGTGAFASGGYGQSLGGWGGYGQSLGGWGGYGQSSLGGWGGYGQSSLGGWGGYNSYPGWGYPGQPGTRLY